MAIRLALWLVLTGAAIAAAQSMPAELSSRLAQAGVTQPVAAWCQGEFRSGHPGAWVVAVKSGPLGGRYLVLESNTAVVELAPFSGGADVACYTATEARKLDRGIRASETIHGQVTPRFSTAVVCAFVEDTSAVCWQYSPVTRAFVRVGRWTT